MVTSFVYRNMIFRMESIKIKATMKKHASKIMEGNFPETKSNLVEYCNNENYNLISKDQLLSKAFQT